MPKPSTKTRQQEANNIRIELLELEVQEQINRESIARHRENIASLEKDIASLEKDIEVQHTSATCLRLEFEKLISNA